VSDAALKPGAFSVGLVTDDEPLVQRVAAVVDGARGRLVVGSDPESAFDIVASDVHALRLIDTMALARLLPDRGRSLAAPALEVWVGAPTHALASNRPFTVHAYARAAIDAALAHLHALFPEVDLDFTLSDLIIGETERVRLLRVHIEHLARFRDVSILVLGETGTGKELVAEAVHRLSFGSSRPFVAVNCAAIPEALIESELFGHEAGAYTGARGARIGLLEAAAGGTIFLDEVGEMPAPLQPKLLRVIETRTFRRVGSNRDICLAARVVSATNRLGDKGGETCLRSDLYYRLAGFTLVLPPLRERGDDVRLLATAFLKSFATRHGLPGLRFGPGVAERLSAHDWPGNIRELRSVIEQAAILAPDMVVSAGEVDRLLGGRPSADPARTVPASTRGAPLRSADHGEPESVRDIERRLVIQGFVDNDRNLLKTSKALGLARTTLRAKLRRWGVI
jgi:transcriptional regulator with GAF, ATPase, and Fis domain